MESGFLGLFSAQHRNVNKIFNKFTGNTWEFPRISSKENMCKTCYRICFRISEIIAKMLKVKNTFFARMSMASMLTTEEDVRFAWSVILELAPVALGLKERK